MANSYFRIGIILAAVVFALLQLPGVFAAAQNSSATNISQTLVAAPSTVLPAPQIIYSSPAGLFVAPNTPYTITVSISSVPQLPYSVFLYFCKSLDRTGSCPKYTSNLLGSVECPIGGCPQSQDFKGITAASSARSLAFDSAAGPDPAINFNFCTSGNKPSDFTCLAPGSYYLDACVMYNETLSCSATLSTIQVLLNTDGQPTIMPVLPSNTVLCGLLRAYTDTVGLIYIAGFAFIVLGGILFLVTKFKPKLIKENKHVRALVIALIMGGIVGILLGLTSPTVFQVFTGYTANQLSLISSQVCAVPSV